MTIGGTFAEHLRSVDEEQRADQKRFVDLCKELRDLGAAEVTAGAYTAKFGAAAPPTQAVPVIRVPIGPQEPKRAPDENLELYPGEKLSDEDKARRCEQQRIRDIVTGS